LSTFDEDILREPTVFCRLASGESLPVSLSAGLFFGILLRPVLLAKESFTRGILISNCSYKNEQIIHTFLSVFIITIPIPFLVLQHLVAWVELLYVDAL